MKFEFIVLDISTGHQETMTNYPSLLFTSLSLSSISYALPRVLLALRV